MTHRLKIALIFLAILLPVGIGVVVHIRTMYVMGTQAALGRRREIASLATRVLGERFDRLKNIAVSLGADPFLKEAIRRGEWREASEQLRKIPDELHFIDRVFLTDAQGVEWGSYPWVDEVMGKDFSYRDWYKGVTALQGPYVSEIYQRAAEPKLNVVAVAAPIREAGEVVGIVVLQVQLNILLGWSVEIAGEHLGTLVFVDQHGHVVGKSERDPQESIEDWSAFAVVRRALTGVSDVVVTDELSRGRQDVVALASEQVSGWGALYVEAAESVFHDRDQQMRQLEVFFGGIVLCVFLGVFLLVVEMGRRHSAEEQVEHGERFLNSVIENIPDMIFVKDAQDLRFLRFNRAGEKLLGRSRAELIGKNDYDFFPKEQADFFTAKDREALQSDRITDITEEPIQTPHGERYLHTKKVPIRSASGQPEYLLGISEDITDKRTLDRAKSDFVSLASHQLRTPLSSMRWSMEILMETMRACSATQRNLAHNIHAAMIRMTGIIQSMLLSSRIEASAIRRVCTFVQVRPLLDDVVREHESLIEKKNIRVSIDCPDALRVETDGELLKEVLLNLMSNAILYSPNGRSVRLRASVRGDRIELCVEDSGIGIPVGEQDKIFQKLYRASNAQQCDVKGTGLGLYVAQSLVQVLGGTIVFTSQENEGSTFTVSLPLRP